MDRIDALKLLLEVSEAKSFSEVARRRAVATSTVTLAVDQLEQEFGARLMMRSTRRLVFTHEGEALLADARRIVAEWDAAVGGLRKSGPLAGPIRITATNDFGRAQLRPLLDGFQLFTLISTSPSCWATTPSICSRNISTWRFAPGHSPIRICGPGFLSAAIASCAPLPATGKRQALPRTQTIWFTTTASFWRGLGRLFQSGLFAMATSSST